MKHAFLSVRTLLLAGIVISGSTLLTGCLKSNNDNPDLPVAGIMAFNLATDKPAVGFSLSGNTLTGSPLAYTSYTGGYLGIYAGTRTVDAFDYNSGNTLASATQSFEQGQYYSSFLAGANNTYRNILVTDYLDSLANNGQAYIRYINAIPDSASPNVRITAGATDVVNGTASFGTVSEFRAATPGSVRVSISNGGNISKERTFDIEQRKIYTVLLLGNPASLNQADSVQIRYIINGTIDENSSGRRNTSARSVSLQ